MKLKPCKHPKRVRVKINGGKRHAWCRRCGALYCAGGWVVTTEGVDGPQLGHWYLTTLEQRVREPKRGRKAR